MRDTIDMAREAGLRRFGPLNIDPELERFEALVRADERDRAMRENAYVQAEREACAKVCEEVLEQYRGTDMGKHAELVGDACANAIRARGNT